jgi:hypothetical protein
VSTLAPVVEQPNGEEEGDVAEVAVEPEETPAQNE